MGWRGLLRRSRLVCSCSRVGVSFSPRRMTNRDFLGLGGSSWGSAARVINQGKVSPGLGNASLGSRALFVIIARFFGSGRDGFPLSRGGLGWRVVVPVPDAGQNRSRGGGCVRRCRRLRSRGTMGVGSRCFLLVGGFRRLGSLCFESPTIRLRLNSLVWLLCPGGRTKSSGLGGLGVVRYRRQCPSGGRRGRLKVESSRVEVSLCLESRSKNVRSRCGV